MSESSLLSDSLYISDSSTSSLSSDSSESSISSYSSEQLDDEYDLPIYNNLILTLENKIESMTDDEYLLNWAPCNIEDRALESIDYGAYACVYCNFEENNDLNFTFANRISTKINIRVPNDIISDNSNFYNRLQLYKGLEDLKQLLGKNNPLDLEYNYYILYKGCEIDKGGIISGDRFCPISLNVYFDIFYYQSKVSIYNTVN